MSTDATEPNPETFLRQATVPQLLDAYDLGQLPKFAKTLADELYRRDAGRFTAWQESGEQNPRRFYEAVPAPASESPAIETARRLETLAREFGLNGKQSQDVVRVVEARGLPYVEAQALLTRSKPRKNPAGFFISALKDDYQAPKPQPTPTQKRQAAQEGPPGWQRAFRDLCRERYPTVETKGWTWAALAPSIREEIQEWMRDHQAQPAQPTPSVTPTVPEPAPAGRSLEVTFRDEQGRSFRGLYREGQGMSWPEQDLAPEVRSQMERVKALLMGTETPTAAAEPARDPEPAEGPDLPVIKIEAESPERARVLVNGRPLGTFEGPNAPADAQRCVAAWLVAELDRDGGLGLTRAAIQDRWQAGWQRENARLRGLVEAALAAEPHELVAWRETARRALAPLAPPAPWALTPQERNVVIEALRGRRGPEADALLKRLLPKAPEVEPTLARFSRSGHEQELWRRAEARHGLKETWTAEFRAKVTTQIGRMMERAEAAAKAGLNPDVEEEVFRYRRNLTRELEQNLKGATDDERRRAADRLEIMVQGKRKALMEGRGRQHPEEGDVVPSVQLTHTHSVKR